MRNDQRSAAALASRRAARTVHNARRIVRDLSRLDHETITEQERKQLVALVDDLDKIVNRLADPSFLHPTLF